MQSYTEIADTVSLTNSRQPLLDNDKTVMSNSSGTVFPTTNLQVGMFCWRTDQSKLYQLKDVTPTWQLLLDLSTGVAIVQAANVLATPRAINGVNFDGSAAISVNNTTALTFSVAGDGAAGGTTFNGGTARTISYNSIGAAKADGTGASGTWNIAISGAAATANALNAANNYTAAYYGTTVNASAGFSWNDRVNANQSWIGYVASNIWRLYSQTALTDMLSVDSTGNLTAVGNVTAYSDIRLKTDLTKISDALTKVGQLTGYTYTRIDTGSKETGLIAQDVRAVLPEAVHVSQLDDKETLSLAYGNLMGLMVEAVKELTARVAVLERRA